MHNKRAPFNSREGAGEWILGHGDRARWDQEL